MRHPGFEKRYSRFHVYALILIALFLAFPMACMAAPFNLDIDLPSTYHNANPGQDVWFTIKLLNLADTGRMDVTLDYNLVDSNGNVLAAKSNWREVLNRNSVPDPITAVPRLAVGNTKAKRRRMC